MKTYVEKKENIKRDWYIIDAKDLTLGRMATRIAIILMGKHKPTYTPFLDTGDFVVVVNASHLKLTGRKADQKVYYTHSHYPGGLKTRPFKKMIANKPDFVVKNAVRLMLPKNRLGRQMLTKLKVYAGNTNRHEAQKPMKLDVENFQKIDSF